jgi:hypothetical protein
MRSYPPAPTPGVPPSNVAAAQWYQQTNSGYGPQNGNPHVSGVLRLEDLQAQFGNVSGASGEPRGYYSQPNRGGYYNQGGYGQPDRGYGDRGYDQRGGNYQGRGYERNDRGRGFYQNQDGRYGSGSGSGYRDNRWR